MKPEPLKNKIIRCRNPDLGEDRFNYSDIKSAIEWLKNQFNIIQNSYEGITGKSANKLVDKAFEDVIK